MSEEFVNAKPFLCGVIEGFYGRPWSPSQRKELFTRMQDMGMNCYLYAPKDDAKHRQLWREMYTVEESDEMQSLINAAKECKVEFVYAISPGLDIAFSSEKDVKTLKRKLEHIRQMGCSSFALLFDDIEPQLSAVDREVFLSYGHAQISLTNDIYQHLGSPECFMFCPTEYCATRAVPDVMKSTYLNLIGSKLFPGIDIMWTGPKVIPRDITSESIEELANVLRRPPLIWDNLHANDYDQKRLFLGPYQGRSAKLIPYLRGVMSNPNCEFEANYVAMHTLAQWSKCCGEVTNFSPNGLANSRPVAVELASDTADTVNTVTPNPLITDVSLLPLYNPRRALLSALQDWLAIMQRSANVKTSKKRPARLRHRKSVAKGLLAAAKGSFPPAAAQELERVSQSAITLPTNSSVVSKSNSPDYTHYIVSPSTSLPESCPFIATTVPSTVLPLEPLSNMEFTQPPVDHVVQVSQPNAEMVKEDPQLARSALLAAAVVAQVTADEANIDALRESMTPLHSSIGGGSIDANNGEKNANFSNSATDDRSYLITAAESIDTTLSIATQQAADLLEQTSEAQLLHLQNDPNLFPAPLSAPPPVFTTAPDNLSCPTSTASNLIAPVSGQSTFMSVSSFSKDVNNTTAVVILQPTSTIFNSTSCYNNAVDMPMEMEEKEFEMMECQNSYDILQQQQKYLECGSSHSSLHSPKPPSSPPLSLQKQMHSGLSSTEVLNDSDVPLENGDEDSTSQDSAPIFTMEDLCLLVDFFYLPYEFGPKAQYLLELLHWLRLNAHFQAVNSSGSDITGEDNDSTKLRQEWYLRAGEFRRLVDSVSLLCERLNNLPNRALLFDLYPYIWDVRTLLSMLDTYITWLSRYPLTSNSFMIMRRLLTWGTPGYKQTFMGGEHEPWMFRGGFTTELQRMLPLEGAVDLFPSRLPPPVLPPNSEQAPVNDSSTSSNPQSEVTALIYVMQVRPYQPESEKDRETVYNLCRRISWLRTHLDYAQTLGNGANLALTEDCFVKRDLHDLPGDRYLLGFLRLCPQYCFLVEDAQGEVCGFAFATDNAKKWYEDLDQQLLPAMREKYPLHMEISSSMHDDDPDSDGMETTDTGFNPPLDEETHISATVQSLKQWFHQREVYPVHVGEKANVSTLVDEASKEADSPHKSVDLSNVEKNFPALIHVDFLPSREVMLWHDDVAKRLLACLLAALRTNGIQGVHCQLSRRETSRIAFYRRYRFEPIEVEGHESNNEIILARSI